MHSPDYHFYDEIESENSPESPHLGEIKCSVYQALLHFLCAPGTRLARRSCGNHHLLVTSVDEAWYWPAVGDCIISRHFFSGR